MLNIFYSAGYISGGRMNGPKKVFSNLIESLQQENIEYAFNEEKYKNNLILHYGYEGHLQHSKLELENCVIGPQIWFFDDHVKFLQENPDYFKSIITPSQWVKDLAIQKFRHLPNKLSNWPVGIKDEIVEREDKYDCLIYFKRRTDQELNKVVEFVESKKMTYNVISYGNYPEEQMKDLSRQSKFCFMLNGTESQGIAVQEIMNHNTPMFVWDVIDWNDKGPEWSVPASSVPYWSDQCGEKFIDVNDMSFTFEKFYDKIGSYKPREFVRNNLSYKSSVNSLMEIFNVN